MPFWEGQASLTILQWSLRAVTVIGWLLLVTKLMGQREIARLNLFDFVVAIAIGSIAAQPLATPRDDLLGPLVSIGVLGLTNIVLAYLALKNAKFRRIVQDEPLVLIQNGKILYQMMKKARLNLDDLLAELRLKNVPNLHDVEFAILEQNGQLSVIPKSQARPVTPQDLNVPTEYEGMPTVVLEDGNIIEDNLRRIGLDKDWLLEQLPRHGVPDPKAVAVAMVDTRGRLYVSARHADFQR